jgi:cobalt-precorrin-5B (C1)-methyltransferase
MVKLAQGALDLHSARSQVDMKFLSELAAKAGLNQSLNERILNANTALEVLQITQENDIDITSFVAQKAYDTAVTALRDAPVELDIIVIDRTGNIIAQASQKTTNNV